MAWKRRSLCVFFCLALDTPIVRVFAVSKIDTAIWSAKEGSEILAMEKGENEHGTWLADDSLGEDRLNYLKFWKKAWVTTTLYILVVPMVRTS